MKIATTMSYVGGFRQSAQEIVDMEKAGLDLVWVAEAYGFDSPSLMGYLAALTERVEIASGIMPIYTRTPTLLAMTAAGLDALSDGRFSLGLGASGPQVIEGFHGVAYTAPITRTRELVEICRNVWLREAPLTYQGSQFQIPLDPSVGTGLGKALKIIAHPVRSRIPIWLAALGDNNVELTAEIAEGWLPLLFIPELAHRAWGDALARGRSKRQADLGPLEISAGGLLAIGEGQDVVKVREQARGMIALYVGGMGAPGKNFYNDLAVRYGFEKEAKRIQDLYLSGHKTEAEAAVPDEFLELTTLCGPRGYVAERIAAFAQAGVTQLNITPVAIGDQTTPQLIEMVKDLAHLAS
jgi:F420-dependent oxidoreductase-like protein